MYTLVPRIYSSFSYSMLTTMKSFLIGTLWFSSLLVPIQGEVTVDLGTAANYAILSKAGITNSGPSVITGDMAVSPISHTSMTGWALERDESDAFSTSTQVTGRIYAATYGQDTPSLLTAAVSAMEAAYTDAAGRANSDDTRKDPLGNGNIDGNLFGGPDSPLTPGIYTFNDFVTITDTIYFEGSATDVFIIQIAGYLTQAADKDMVLEGGALAENIFWQVAGYVEVGARANMEGIILGKTGVTFVVGSSLNGRIFAQTAVALQQATISESGGTDGGGTGGGGTGGGGTDPGGTDPGGTDPGGTDGGTDSNGECTSTTPSRIRRLQGSELFERWDIAEPAFTYESLDFTLDFEINQYIASVEQVTYTLFDETCDNAYGGNGLSGSRGLTFGSVEAAGKQSIEIAMAIDASVISADSEVYSESMVDGEMAAVVDFCVRFALHTPAEIGELEVNFLEIVITLNVDLTAGFEIGALAVAPLDRCVNTAAQDFLVEGYFCEENNEPNSTVTAPVFNQGDLVKICVRPVQDAREEFFIRMLRITSFVFERGSTNQPAIADGISASVLTDLFCDAGFAICHFETILFAAFYQSPGSVTGSGIADMQFGGETSADSVSPRNRRLLRENRKLQADGGASGGAEFDLEVFIIPSEDSDFTSAASSSGGLFAIAVAAGAMVLWSK
jgi:hypothetical protein